MTDPIDRLLRNTLKDRKADNPATPCLDAELAAAFADNTLTRHERSRVEAHVADCVRCQAWLAALEQTRPFTVPRAWWRRPAVAWLGSIAAAATAFAAWIYVAPGGNVARRAVASRTAPNGTRPVDVSASRQNQAASVDDLAARVAAPPPTPAPSREATSATQARDESTARSKTRSSAQAPSLADGAGTAPAAPRQSAAVASSKPEAPLASRPLPQTSPAPPSAGPIAAPSQNAAESAVTPTPLAETLAMKAERADRLSARERALARDAMIDAADPGSRWRVAEAGVVQHSADGGATWQTQSTGVSVRLTAGSSPSRAVCWLVGPAGTIVMTMDEGRTWKRLAFPERIDLVAIRATDSDTAEVVTADARTFRTSDRGKTWKR